MIATAAQPLARKIPVSEWFPAFLRSELAPYPGRAAAVARITIAVVITFILVSTFRIPGSAITLYMVFTVTRENPSAAVKSALMSIGAITAGLAFSMLGVALFIDSQLLHFLYTMLEFFVLFWLVRVMVQPSAATNMALAVYNVSNIWALPFPAEVHLETTLWFWVSLSLGSMVAAVVEVLFVRHDPIDQLLSGIDERLRAVESLARGYDRSGSDIVESAEAKKITDLALVGTGVLRRQLRSAENGQATLRQYLSELSAVIALAGRLVDLSANMAAISRDPQQKDCVRLGKLAEELARIRNSIRQRQRPESVVLTWEERSADLPLLPELEKTVGLIPQAFSPAETKNAAVISALDEKPRTRLLVTDAFSNPEYVRFALKGCLAAAICYILYTAADWPGISTSVITCLLTALSTLGASRQKQFLRITGASFGGLLAIGSIVFLFPQMDRITGVALVMAAVSAFGGWVAVSSPRLSYFGLQTCLAFYVTTLQDYAAPTSLSPARDRFVGVLLGLTVMWIVFDNLWPTDAASEMVKRQRANVRLIGRLLRVLDDVEGDREAALPRIRSLRETINGGFAAVQEHAGTVLFEFGADRRKKLELRDSALRVQASIRALFLLELAILQYRVQWKTTEIPTAARKAQIEFDEAAARVLDQLADAVPAAANVSIDEVKASFAELERALESWHAALVKGPVSTGAEGVRSLSRQMIQVLDGIP